jgi:hypothetical protein
MTEVEALEQIIASLQDWRTFLIRQAAETGIPNPHGIARIDHAIANATHPDRLDAARAAWLAQHQRAAQKENK